jgi:hypothetical protein
MRTKKPTAKPDPKAQHERFMETARQLKCDEDKERFEQKLKQIATAGPKPKPQQHATKGGEKREALQTGTALRMHSQIPQAS